MAGLYDLGEGVWIRAAFSDPSSGAAMDPSTVRVKILPPSASSPTVKVYGTDLDVIRESLGAFAFLVTADEQGYWQYRWEGENVAPVVVEGSFYVRRADL